MKKEYHYLVAGLPDLLFDATKLSFTVPEFRESLKDQLSAEDFLIIQSYFWRYDNKNLLGILLNNGSEFNEKGNLTREDWENILDLIKNDEFDSLNTFVPSYFKEFIEAFKEDKSVYPGISWENQLTRMYYDYVLSLNNEFTQTWYGFEVDLENILTAGIGKKYQVNIESELIGESEINEKLIKSNARDFGLGNDIPRIEQVFRSVEEPDLFEREKKLDFLKWDLLEEWSFFHYFTVERIFVYLLELDIIDRWIKLDRKTGEELFNRMLKNLETQNKFPENM